MPLNIHIIYMLLAPTSHMDNWKVVIGNGGQTWSSVTANNKRMYVRHMANYCVADFCEVFCEA